MATLLVRRRHDGLVEIRRARWRDLVLTSDAAVLLGMLAGWLLFVATLVMALVFAPLAIGVAALLVLLFVADGGARSAPRLVEAPVPPPPRGAA